MEEGLYFYNLCLVGETTNIIKKVIDLGITPLNIFDYTDEQLQKLLHQHSKDFFEKLRFSAFYTADQAEKITVHALSYYGVSDYVISDVIEKGIYTLGQLSLTPYKQLIDIYKLSESEAKKVVEAFKDTRINKEITGESKFFQVLLKKANENGYLKDITEIVKIKMKSFKISKYEDILDNIDGLYLSKKDFCQITKQKSRFFHITKLDDFFGTKTSNQPLEEQEVKKPRLTDYIKTLPNNRSVEYFIDYLNGMTLEEIGQNDGISRERVRQVMSKVRDNIPELYENRYFDFYKKNKYSEKEFCTLFDEESVVYRYVRLMAK